MPSYRNRNQMAQQMDDLLRHYRNDDPTRRVTAQDILETAIAELWRRTIGDVEQPSIVGWDELVLARDTPCAETGTIIPAGTWAWREVWTDGREGDIYSREVLEADGVL